MQIAWDVFLAHPSAEKPWVRELAAALSRLELKVYVDEGGVAPGDRWQQQLKQALEQSRAIVVLITSGFDEAYYLQEEVARAIELSRRDRTRVIPVYKDGFPDSLSQVPYGLANLHGLGAAGMNMEQLAAKISQAVACAPPAGAGPMGSRSENSPQASGAPWPVARKVLYRALCALNTVQLEEVIRIELEAPSHQFGGSAGPHGLRAMNLLDWAAGQGEEVSRALVEAVWARAPAYLAQDGGPP